MAGRECVGKRLSFGAQLNRRLLSESIDEDTDAALFESSVAVLTSGGDAQGMNAALRAIVRMVLFNGMNVFAIHEGYQGLVKGGECIEECKWTSVDDILHRGGTAIGTARCKAFHEREGRLRAAENLVKLGVNNLVVIGGDGSLTGANVFKSEWRGLVSDLQKSGRVTDEEASACSYLNIVGLVGSIDNDMCGTDMTIGTDSALHRIIEAIDCLTSTAASHQRSFVLEVMGRHCGYLALMAGLAGGADWVLIPENPPRPGWEEVMCEKISSCRKLGRRLSLVIVAEGAVDTMNKPITSQHVKQVLEKQLGHDTRITVLGHVQRGGKPSAYDRLIGCRMGAAAALVILQAQGEIPPKMIGVQGNKIVEAPLMNCVQRTRAVNKAMSERNFKLAIELRGESFSRNLRILKQLAACGPARSTSHSSPKYRIAVMNIGTPAAGMNSTLWSFVRLIMYQGHTVMGIGEGIEGLLKSDIHEMSWSEVNGLCSAGGSYLGTNCILPTEENLPRIAANIAEHNIQGLLVIGGFEGYEALLTLEKYRDRYVSFRIPILGIAATISNNVPGTEYSLGCDTALNTIVASCDVLKQSAHASRKKVFVVETMGGNCGYLATMAGLAAGADTAYIFEEKFSIADMQRDVACLTGKFKKEKLERGIIIRNENCNVNFTSKFMCQLLAEEGKGLFVTHSNILGHLQQGDHPSPYDRILGIQYAAHAVDFFQVQLQKNRKESGAIEATGYDSACMLGVRGTKIVATPFQTLRPETDFKNQIPNTHWWISLHRLLKVLARNKEHRFLGEQYLKTH